MENAYMAIHPTAIIDPRAELDSTVEVGPYAIIDGPAKIGARTRLRAHAQVLGWTEMGEDCEVYSFAVVGGAPQDFHYKGERSYCRIGNRVFFREGSTVHCGSQPESATIVGDDSYFLTNAHAGHNCEIGKAVQVQHGALLAGHVTVHDHAILGAASMVHQFCRIGSLAFLASGARLTMDVPPFFMAFGVSSVVQHNVVGMRRAGYSREELFEIREAFRTLYRSGLLFRAAIEQLSTTIKTPAGRILLEFLQAESKRGVCRSTPHRDRPGNPDPEVEPR
jgi:UDP-N-acetylglucosamine acyltransferase